MKVVASHIYYMNFEKTRPSGQRCVLKHFWAYPLIKMREMQGGNLSTAIATLSGRYPKELLWCYLWLTMPSWSFLCIKFSISCIFHESITYGPTDGRTDRRTDGRTDGQTRLSRCEDASKKGAFNRHAVAGSRLRHPYLFRLRSAAYIYWHNQIPNRPFRCPQVAVCSIYSLT